MDLADLFQDRSLQAEVARWYFDGGMDNGTTPPSLEAVEMLFTPQAYRLRLVLKLSNILHLSLPDTESELFGFNITPEWISALEKILAMSPEQAGRHPSIKKGISEWGVNYAVSDKDLAVPGFAPISALAAAVFHNTWRNRGQWFSGGGEMPLFPDFVESCCSDYRGALSGLFSLMTPAEWIKWNGDDAVLARRLNNKSIPLSYILSVNPAVLGSLDGTRMTPWAIFARCLDLPDAGWITRGLPETLARFVDSHFLETPGIDPGDTKLTIFPGPTRLLDMVGSRFCDYGTHPGSAQHAVYRAAPEKWSASDVVRVFILMQSVLAGANAGLILRERLSKDGASSHLGICGDDDPTFLDAGLFIASRVGIWARTATPNLRSEFLSEQHLCDSTLRTCLSRDQDLLKRFCEFYQGPNGHLIPPVLPESASMADLFLGLNSESGDEWGIDRE